MRNCYHKSCDDIRALTDLNLEFVEKTTNALVAVITDLARGSCTTGKTCSSTDLLTIWTTCTGCKRNAKNVNCRKVPNSPLSSGIFKNPNQLHPNARAYWCVYTTRGCAVYTDHRCAQVREPKSSPSTSERHFMWMRGQYQQLIISAVFCTLEVLVNLGYLMVWYLLVKEQCERKDTDTTHYARFGPC